MLELKYIDNTVIEVNTIYDYYIPVIIKFKKMIEIVILKII